MTPEVIPAAWALDAVITLHPGLRLAPSPTGVVVLRGLITFSAHGKGQEPITDTYEVALHVPKTFPEHAPVIYETGGRIPLSFHRFAGGQLCLAAPIRIALFLQKTPTLQHFIDELVIPYLYAHSYHLRHHRMPHGELAHGTKGLSTDLQSLFHLPPTASSRELLVLGRMRRRVANKHDCFCGSGVRLGQCHNVELNRLRDSLGRRWFRAQLRDFDELAEREKSQAA